IPWALFDPAGTIVGGFEHAPVPDIPFSPRTVDLIASGTYSLVINTYQEGLIPSGFSIDPSSFSAVAYSFQITTPSLVSEPLTLNTTISDSVPDVGGRHIYTFDATIGQTIYFDAIAGSAKLISPSG